MCRLLRAMPFRGSASFLATYQGQEDWRYDQQSLHGDVGAICWFVQHHNPECISRHLQGCCERHSEHEPCFGVAGDDQVGTSSQEKHDEGENRRLLFRDLVKPGINCQLKFSVRHGSCRQEYSSGDFNITTIKIQSTSGSASSKIGIASAMRMFARISTPTTLLH